MVSIAPEVAQTLTALSTATVFSVGFLSARVHRERGRAIDRVLKLDDQIASAVRDNKPLDADWFDDQVEALEWSLKDRLDWPVLGLNLALGFGVIGLAVGFGLTGDVSWSGSQGVLLVAFAVSAFAVITIGTLDVMLARRDVKRHYEATTVGQMNLADSLLRRAAKRPGPTSKQLKQLSDTAESAVRSGHGLYGPAWAMLGYAHLLSMERPSSRRPDLLSAEQALERAIELGPETAPMRAALARVYEWRGDNKLAAANWVRASWIYHEAVRPLAYLDQTATPRRARERARGSSPLREGPYSWRFMPETPFTLSLALDQLPPRRSVAGFTAQKIVTQSSSFPQSDKERIKESLIRWLESWIQPGIWEAAENMAAWLLTLQGSPEVLAAIEEFRSAERGPIGQAKAAYQANREKEQKEHAEWQESMRASLEEIDQTLEIMTEIRKSSQFL